MQPSFIVARGLTNVTTSKVLFATTAARAGVQVAVLAWRPLLLGGSAYLRVDLDFTDRFLEAVLNAERMAMGRKIFVFTFVLRARKFEDGV